jgi:hypothetical protein
VTKWGVFVRFSLIISSAIISNPILAVVLKFGLMYFLFLGLDIPSGRTAIRTALNKTCDNFI